MQLAEGNIFTSLLHVLFPRPPRGAAATIIGFSAKRRSKLSKNRVGQLRAGTQEFGHLTGSVSESWEPDTSGEEDAPDGRIELLATYVSSAESLE